MLQWQLWTNAFAAAFLWIIFTKSVVLYEKHSHFLWISQKISKTLDLE